MLKKITNIFIIDDEAAICNSLKRILRINNFSVKTFLAVEEFFDYIEKNPNDIPELIMTDYKLKGQSGLILLEKIKEKFPDISVILMTGYGDKKLAIESLRFGADDFLDKPINTDDVMIALNKIKKKRVATNEYENQKNATILNELNAHLNKMEEIENILQSAQQELKEKSIDISTKEKELKIKDELLTNLHFELESKHFQLIQSGKLAALGQLAASVSHEINQPLFGISMGIDNILNKVEKNSFNEDYLKKKCQTLILYVERIKSIIEHIRIFSREQSNKKPQPFNVLKSIQQAESMVKAQFTNHNINIQNNWNYDEYIILGNEYKLEQIIINLIINAKDAALEKMKNANNSYRPEIKIIVKKENNKVTIEIEDNGGGIAEENIEKIFQPFFTTKPEEKGTGLGLSIVHSLISEMRGEISVASVPGEWTRFILKFDEAQTAN